MPAQVGALRVTLGANTANFEQGMQRAQRQARQTGQNIERSFDQLRVRTTAAFGAIRVAAAGVGAGLVGGVLLDQGRQALTFAANLTEASRAIGVTVEQYQILNRAAIENGASTETMERALGILNRTLGQARAGVGSAVEAFRALRIDPEQFRSAGEVLPVVMERIRSLSTASEQAAAAQRLFGRSAQDLLPMLVQGAEGYDRMATAAQEAGLITEDMARKADDAADKIALLGVTLRTRLAAGLIDTLPAIEDVAGGLVQLGRAAGWALTQMSRAIGMSEQMRAAGANALPGVLSQASSVLRTLSMGPAGIVVGAVQMLGRATRTPELEMGRNFRDMVANAGRQPDFGDLDLDLSGGGGRGGRRGGGGGRSRATRPLTRTDELMSSLSPWVFGRNMDEMEQDVRDLTEGLGDVDALMESIAATPIPDLGNMLTTEDREEMERFARSFREDLVGGLAEAIVYGKNLGDALVATFQRAAAELISSGLMRLLTGQGPSTGGLLGSVLGAFRIGSTGINGGTFGPSVAAGASGASSLLAGFATGGNFMVGGRGGIDRNILSINGSPVARVSRGETVGVGWSGGGKQKVEVVVHTSPLLTAQIVAGDAVAASEGALQAQTAMVRRQVRRIP